MLQLEQARAMAKRELGAFLTTLEQAHPGDWHRSVRCDGWTVSDLASHVAESARQIAAAYTGMRTGSTDVSPGPALASEPGAILRALRERREAVERAADALDEESLTGIFKNATVSFPGAVGLYITVLEFGTHHNDLEWALGNEEPLAADVAAAVASRLGNLLTFLALSATEKPARDVLYRVGTSALAFGDGTWAVVDGAEPDCEITGDDSAIALFVLGRIGSDHPSVKVAGDEALARAFKRYFPGP